MPLKSDFHCPTSGNAKKVTVEDAIEKLSKRQLRKKMKQEDYEFNYDLEQMQKL